MRATSPRTVLPTGGRSNPGGTFNSRHKSTSPHTTRPLGGPIPRSDYPAPPGCVLVIQEGATASTSSITVSTSTSTGRERATRSASRPSPHPGSWFGFLTIRDSLRSLNRTISTPISTQTARTSFFLTAMSATRPSEPLLLVVEMSIPSMKRALFGSLDGDGIHRIGSAFVIDPSHPETGDGTTQMPLPGDPTFDLKQSVI